MSEEYLCYRCQTLLEVNAAGTLYWCPTDHFWVDKPWEPRAEMPVEPLERGGSQ